MELNREQIIKALECCAKDDCDNCPNSFGNCYSNLAGYALALIRELSGKLNTAREEAVLDFCDKIYDVSYEGRHGKLVEFVSIEDIVREMFGSKEGR